MTNILKVATLGTPFVQDPSLSLINYIKNNWNYAEVPVIINTDSISLNPGLGQIHGYKSSAFPAGQITGFSLDVKVAAGNIRIKLYSDVSGVPTNLLAESDVITIPGTGVQRFNFTIPYENLTVADLWFMYEYDNAAARFGGAASGTETYETHVFGEGPSTWATTGTLSQTTWMTIYYQPMFAVLKSRCYFDNKWGRADIPNEIVVERVMLNDEITALGMQRIRNYDQFLIQLVTRGDNAINNLFLMQQHVEDLINGNPTAERGDGFDEFRITGWQPVKLQSDDDISASVVDTLAITMARSKALVTVIYDKYPASS